ncbi:MULTISPECIES: FN3 domain-containing metallophosphoesterase family protein [Dyella]|nr:MULTISPECIES: FN3 domain-containing metallophosphoesterase family protein [Dyella]
MTYRHWLAAFMMGVACVSIADAAGDKPRKAVVVDDDDANAPYKTFDSTPAITMGPLLLDVSEDSVIVEWMTDSPSDAKVLYGEAGLTEEALPQTDGLVPVGNVHRVILRGLKPGHTYQYKVASRRVVNLRPYWPDRGRTVESPVSQFTTFDATRPSTRFVTMTDTHEDVGRVRALMDMARQAKVDFVVHTGDGVHYAVNENQVKDKFLGPVADGLQGSIPLIYARGNHEYRGEFARSLGDYLHEQSGRYFYTRDQGPVHLVVVDTGEDKPDATNVYAGLNNLREYRKDELAWFAHVLAAEPRTKSAPFTVVLGHDPEWGWSDGQNAEWTRAANAAKVDLYIAGHLHRLERIPPGKQGNDFPILALGQDQVAQVDATATELKVRVIDRTGKILDAFTVARKAK